MSTTPNANSGDGRLPPELVQMLRSLFREHADEVIEAIGASGFDPTQMLDPRLLDADPAARAFLTGQLRRVLARPNSDDPVNWEVAHDLARQAAHAGGDPSVTAAEARAVSEALAVAELWLDPVTEFPRAGGRVSALSVAEWIEATLPAWRRMVTPVAASVANALASAIGRHGAPLGEDVSGGIKGMLRAIGGAVFGMQIGHAVGTLSREVMGLSDIGIPLADPTATALAPTGIARFASGLDSPAEEVRLFVAAREAATARLFTHAPWLGGHLLGAVEAYARGIVIDVDAVEEAVRGIDPGDPEAMREAISGGLFEMTRSPEQNAALERLETALALVEGWVDRVTADATREHLPDAAALGEMIRRRRAAGGPAERAFATLVGLELRPRRAREASRLWGIVADEAGQAEREGLWGHPDLLPTAGDLTDPSGFLARRAARAEADAAVDAAIAELLDNPDAGGGGSGGDRVGDGGDGGK
ncbi:MAG: zinc-dependent metalloprotease [Bifidobacteriaceae bacterium]|jgi:putative hydrolase|nr:zinc-dependent metalloprotease [Bifidobacteriaceae bacterium]